MNLARHAAVLWRFRAVTVAGLVVGLLLAVLASYKVPSMERRGTSTYMSEAHILVTQRGFPEGRVVLPQAPPPGTEAAEAERQTGSDSDESSPLEFADPGRLMALADLYTQLITSDQVRSRIPQNPDPAQITAAPVPANSGAILPIISLTTVGPTPQAAHDLNVATIEALKGLIADESKRYEIAPGERVELQMLKASSPGALLTGPGRTASILALLLCVIGTIALTHLLETLRTRRHADQLEELETWAIGEVENGAAPREEQLTTVLHNGDWSTPSPRARHSE
jgi:hypothetical protein